MTPLSYEQNPATTERPLSELTELLMTDKWIGHVAKTREVDLRGHRVALTYHYYARAVDSYINRDHSFWRLIEDQEEIHTSNANWFNFATWATVTINRDLILGHTPAAPGRLLPSLVRRSLTPSILHLRAADGQRVSRALSWGQRLVFISTTMIFLCWKNCAHSPSTGTKDSTYGKILDLATWGTQQYLDPSRHLDVIWSAFDHYRLARDAHSKLTSVPTERVDHRSQLRQAVARHILVGNILITAVEQDIVNDAVGEVIDYVPQAASRSATISIARWAERLSDVPRQITGLNLPYQLARLTDGLESAWARLMTEQILVIMFASETLRMGLDIPPLDVTQPYFQPDLADLTHPVDGQTPESCQYLNRLVSQFDRTLGDGRGSGAHDWRRYDERMNWAVTMIRSRQQLPALFWAPYSGEDQRRIVRGELPHAGGDPSDYEVEAPVDGLPSWYQPS